MDLLQYKLILEASPNMIWRSNLTTECDYFNKTWLDFTGRTFEQEYGFGWAEGVHPEDYDRCVKLYLDSFDKRQRFEMDYRLKNSEGKYRWINDRGVPFNDEEGAFIGFIGSCMDVTEKIEGQILKDMAQNDFLSRTYNRQYSYQLLKEIFDQSWDESLPLTLLMIDIDDFKHINDQYGHAAGDAVLKALAVLFKNEIRFIDILGRYGGDEFLAGLVHSNLEDAVSAANRIRIAVENNSIAIPDFPPIRVTVSIGVKSLDGELTLDELIDKADKKLYEAKKDGKNRVKA